MNTQTHLENHSHHNAGQNGSIGRHVLGRWPSLLGLAALLFNVTNGADSHVTAMIIVIASMCYLAASAIGRQHSGWVVVAVASIAVVLARLTGLDPTATLLVMGAGFAAFGFLRGRNIDRRELTAQTLAFGGFSAIALTAMVVNPVAALYLAALGAIGHAGWDVIYFVRNKVVPRSLAEACFMLDLGLGVALLLIAWLGPF
ncbi:hypothetical protein RND64_08685 [Gordonia sp. w5E2]|uniref:Permease n=1 Tax=Gordonia jacobaea TaxID=122202 RepID=A0ABR5I754_9ACTN|nr:MULTISPECIES: hypothetical protein [Gordonia]KNA89427.1 hypothetical protein ABW18_20720 [Gordonia jacobaea]